MIRRAAMVVLLALAGGAIYVAIRAHRDLTDFEVYRTAAIRAAAAEPLYRPDDGHYQFKYLPAFAIAARPLAWLDEEPAKIAWYALSFLLVAILLETLLTHVPERRLSVLTLSLLTGLVMARFLVRELALGQTNVLLVVWLLPAVVSARRHPIVAGAGVGIAIFVKPYAALLLPWLVVALPVGATMAAATAILAGLVLPVFTYGWGGNLLLLREWWRTVTDTTGPNLLHPDNISVASLWAKWIGPGTVASALTFATDGVLLALAVVVILRGGRRERSDYLDVGLLLLLTPLLSPQGWDYVLLLAMPVVILAIDRWQELPVAWRTAFVATAVVWAAPLRLLVPVDVYDAVMATGVVSVAALVLVAVAVVLRRRQVA